MLFKFEYGIANYHSFDDCYTGFSTKGHYKLLWVTLWPLTWIKGLLSVTLRSAGHPLVIQNIKNRSRNNPDLLRARQNEPEVPRTGPVDYPAVFITGLNNPEKFGRNNSNYFNLDFGQTTWIWICSVVLYWFLNQGMNCKYEYLLDAFHQIIQCNSGHIAEGSQCRKVFSLGFSELDKTFTTTSSAPCVWGYYTLVVNII